MIEATPTTTWKSSAICGNSESAERTMHWLAKPATARNTMARVCEGAAGESGGKDGARDCICPLNVRRTLTVRGLRGFYAQTYRLGHDRKQVPARRDRGPHVCGLGRRACVPRRPARAEGCRALLHRDPAAQRDRVAAHGSRAQQHAAGRAVRL